jgi:hypothetical protein
MVKAESAKVAESQGWWGDISVKRSLWNGYLRQDFVLDGRLSILVSPVDALPYRPWIWRTEFFGAFPSLDIALLGRGYHLAYIDVQNL